MMAGLVYVVTMATDLNNIMFSLNLLKSLTDLNKDNVKYDMKLLQSRQQACPLNWNGKQLKQGMHYNDPKRLG